MNLDIIAETSEIAAREPYEYKPHVRVAVAMFRVSQATKGRPLKQRRILCWLLVLWHVENISDTLHWRERIFGRTIKLNGSTYRTSKAGVQIKNFIQRDTKWELKDEAEKAEHVWYLQVVRLYTTCELGNRIKLMGRSYTTSPTWSLNIASPEPICSILKWCPPVMYLLWDSEGTRR